MARIRSRFEKAIFNECIDGDLYVLPRYLVAASDLRYRERFLRVQEFEDRAVGNGQSVRF